MLDETATRYQKQGSEQTRTNVALLSSSLSCQQSSPSLAPSLPWPTSCPSSPLKMFAFILFSLLLATPAFSQDIVLNSGHNVTTLPGTWSSGSQNVVTGEVSHPHIPHVSHVTYTHIPDRALPDPPTNRSSTPKQPACLIHCESIPTVEYCRLR